MAQHTDPYPIYIIDLADKTKKEAISTFQLNHPELSSAEVAKAVEDAFLSALPADWNPILRAIKLHLRSPDTKHSLNSASQLFGSAAIEIYAAGYTKADRIKRQQLCENCGGDRSYVKDIVAAIEEWGKPSIRHKHSKARYKSKRFSRWTYEFSLIAQQRIPLSFSSWPIAAWRVRTQLLIPLIKWKHGVPRSELLPIVRIELIKSALPLEIDELYTALFESIESLTSAYVEELEHLQQDSYHELEFNLELYLNSKEAHLAQRFTDWFSEEFAYDNYSSLSPEYRPYQCLVYTGSAPIEDEPQPRKTNTNATTLEKEQVLLLTKFELNNVAVMNDMQVFQTWEIKTRDTFFQDYDCRPDQLLEYFMFDHEAFDEHCIDGDPDEYIIDLVDGDRSDFLAIRDALLVQTIPPGRGRFPQVCLLIDPKTREHQLALSLNKPNMSTFLSHAIPSFQSNGTKYKAIKIASSLEKAYPGITGSIGTLEIVRPASGADGGAQYSRLWRLVVDEIFWRRELGLGSKGCHRFTWEEFQLSLNEVSDHLNVNLTEDHAQLSRFSQTFPASLKKRTAF